MSQNQRPDWDDYFLSIASVVASRSTCLRARYGAVIVSQDHSIISTGYNGAPVGVMSCFEKGFCLRDKLVIQHGEHYEICYSVHSEPNAILRAGKSVRGCDIYISGFRERMQQTSMHHAEIIKELIDCTPCFMCKRLMINAGLRNCIYRQPSGELIKEGVKWWAHSDIHSYISERREAWELSHSQNEPLEK